MKLKNLLLALGLGTTLALAACGGSDDSSSSDSSSTKEESTMNDDSSKTETAVDAEKIFANNCASCHGNNLEGNVGPNLTKVGSKYSSEEIQEIIKNGKGQMPAGILKEDEEIVAVADWLADKK
ncbi:MULTISPECIES: cytochrome c551 [Exiguobacterium]|uniref:Cytochrome c n=1 Tax=Exiguobacterium indicum TaxID=296995 RepID=A0ABU8EG06_9BACL|nr:MULTISPECIES: cytochrome c [Exiguobacterium]AHA30620.1 cytochrome C551 [Exiguobacterium sp. MH3]MBF8152011.1 cytochrome c [Exiguobacterium sp. TBG-PICH-001]MCQ4089344.1 cytochrome c [Exiguobacterium sp. LL15]SDB89657.1 cytochrome c551 [Exiguobacterium enclense]